MGDHSISSIANTNVEHFDVLIIGAGIAGIGAGYKLSEEMPHKSYVILDARGELGGTWSLFKYPGIRSDSEMYTYGYSFHPWTRKNAIAPACEILDYLHEVAEERNVDKHIRFHHRVIGLSWSSEEARWTVTAEQTMDHHIKTFTAQFLYVGAGYYSYKGGYTPEFKGREDFHGTIIHPQDWPEGFDYTNKEVVVIGSGATAVTLIPSMVNDVKKITMLQRSPTYIFPFPQQDKLAHLLLKILPKKLASKIIYTKGTIFSVVTYQLAQKFPRVSKKLIKSLNKHFLPKGFDMKHFTPSYNPWDQRVCMDTDAKLFKSIATGKATVVTDHIDHFDETGIVLKSGQHLNADVIITATGLNMKFYEDVTILIDGKPLDISSEMAYLGAMLTNVPNLIFGVGYTNASWTLKMELTYSLLIDVLRKLDSSGASYLVIRKDPTVKEHALHEVLSSTYLQRVVQDMPRSGDRAPWISHMSYYADRRDYRNKNLDAPEIELHWAPKKTHAVSGV